MWACSTRTPTQKFWQPIFTQLKVVTRVQAKQPKGTTTPLPRLTTITRELRVSTTEALKDCSTKRTNMMVTFITKRTHTISTVKPSRAVKIAIGDTNIMLEEQRVPGHSTSSSHGRPIQPLHSTTTVVIRTSTTTIEAQWHNQINTWQTYSKTQQSGLKNYIWPQKSKK